MLKIEMNPAHYPHRTNPDGTIDAICPRCYVTIGTSIWESELEQMEAAHVCDAGRLEYFRRRERDSGKDDRGASAERPRLRLLRKAGNSRGLSASKFE
jgi:hypothetical protein